MGKALSFNEQQVRLIRAAIREAITGAKSATLSSSGTSNSYTRHGLDELRKLEAYYLGLVAKERRGGCSPVVVADFGSAL